MDLKELCEKIDLQSEMSKEVWKCHKINNYNEYYDSLIKLYDRNTWEQGIKELEEVFGEDVNGVKMLTCLLNCATYTYQLYRNKNISEKIFIDSMKFCTRFVGEHFEAHGTYKFVWGWWFPRQLSMSEFRIGELEYEMLPDCNGEKCIGIHIPSDAVLKLSELRNSYLEAKKFFNRFYPQYTNAKMICESWLLSPSLKEILPETSNIITYQNLFNIVQVDAENDGYLHWIYKKGNIPFEELPENTTLQREVKKYILNGKKIGAAQGTLMESLLSN